MDRELILTVSVFLLVILAFILSIVITEKNNIKKLKGNNTQPIIGANEEIVKIPPISDKAEAFHKNKVIVWIISLLWGLLVPAVYLLSGLSSGIRNWAERISINIIAVTAVYFTVYSLVNYLIDLPLNYYSGFKRKHAFGLSNQNFSKWIGDSLKALLITIIIGAAFLWIPYIIIMNSPIYWWIYVGLMTIPILIFTTYISPVYIDPLFNKYTDLVDKELESKIHEMLNQTIVGDCRVFQVNKSVDTKEMNAYMTGIFNTKRIVLWDTTINNLTQKEILSVVAHEMGHYLMGHIWRMIFLGGILSTCVFYLLDRIAGWVMTHSGGVFGFYKLYDIASLPLIILLIDILVLAFMPFVNWYSRYNEKEADRFELELTRDNQSGASAMVKLHHNSLILAQTGIIYKLWNYSHPTFKERVGFANNYKPWEENKPLKYQKYILKQYNK